jgi:hypothetical protein
MWEHLAALGPILTYQTRTLEEKLASFVSHVSLMADPYPKEVGEGGEGEAVIIDRAPPLFTVSIQYPNPVYRFPTCRLPTPTDAGAGERSTAGNMSQV